MTDNITSLLKKHLCKIILLAVLLAAPLYGQTATPEQINDSLAKGRFDLAQQQFDALSAQQKTSPWAGSLRDLLTEYRKLNDQKNAAFQESYDEHYQKMIDNAKLAGWRKELLDTSTRDPLDIEEKKQFETEQQDLIQKKWLGALAQWTICKSIAERSKVNEKADPQLTDEIIRRSLDYAKQLERDQQWLEAYQRVYSYLTSLDPQNEEYEQHATELIRKASLVAIYVPDPNQDAVSWQERRKGIDFDIINDSLGILNNNYVEQPDYVQMSEKAIDYCRLIANTPKISDTFTSLNDDNKKTQYLTRINALADELKNLPSQQYGYYYLLSFMRKAIKINQDTLALPEEVMMAEFAEGAFAALDGYTYIVWPGDVDDFRKDMTGEFYGVGIMIGKPEGLLTVSSLLEESPARQAGIDAGDTITAIDGKSTTNITLDMAVKRITGKEGTTVVLTINREGFEQPKDFTITRQKIVVNDVKGLYRDGLGQWQYFVDPDNTVAYVRLTNFFAETADRVRTIYDQCKKQNLKGLILDLRNNSGGYLSTAVQIVDEFVSEGVIVSTRRRGDTEGVSDFATKSYTLDDNIPLVVLVNSISASASEIVSGALQDYHRAVIVGEHTFGKGNVQTIQPLRPSSAEMKITIAYYYLPSNRKVHRNPKDKLSKDYGVIPDVSLELTSNQLRTMIETQQKATILHQNGHNGNSEKWTTYTPDQLIESDPQLKMALLCIKALQLKNNLTSL